MSNKTGKIIKAFDSVLMNPSIAIWKPTQGKRFVIGFLLLSSSIEGNIVLTDGVAYDPLAPFDGQPVLAVIPSAQMGESCHIDWENKDFGISATSDNQLFAYGPETALLSGMLWGEEI